MVGVPLLHRLRDGQAGYDGEDDVGDWRDVSSEAFIVVFGGRLVVIGIHCVTSPGGTGPWS